MRKLLAGLVLSLLLIGAAQAQPSGGVGPGPIPYFSPPTSSTQRAPLQTDDTNSGYAAGYLWLNSTTNQLYENYSATAGDAVWYQTGTNNGMLCDVIVCQNAWGAIKLSSSYAGNAFVVTRASDSTTKAIGYVQGPHGVVIADYATADAFCAGTTCTYSTLYDNIGNKDMTQATGANQLVYTGNTLNGFRSITFAGSQVGSVVQKMNNSSITCGQNACSLFMVGRLLSSTALGTIGEWTSNGSATGSMLGFNKQMFTIIGSGAGGLTQNLLNTDSLGVIGITWGSSTITGWSNDRSQANSESAGSATMTGLTLGNTSRAAGYQGMLDALAFIVGGSAYSSATVQTLNAAADQAFGFTPQNHDTVFCFGDSIAGGLVSNNNGWCQQMSVALRWPYRVVDQGIVSYTAALGVSGVTNFVTPLFQPNAKNYVIVALGINDIGTATTVQLEGYLTSICGSIHTAGGKCILQTITSGNFSGANETERTTVNAWMISSGVADGVSNPGADPNVGCQTCSTNSTYFASGVHPNALGHSIIMQYAAAAVNSLP